MNDYGGGTINTNRIRAVTTLGTLIICGAISIGNSVTLNINAQNKEGIDITLDGNVEDVYVTDNVLMYDTGEDITNNFKYTTSSINDSMELIEREAIVVEHKQINDNVVQSNTMNEYIALALNNDAIGLDENELAESDVKLVQEMESQQKIEKEAKKAVITMVNQSDALLEIDQPDSNYTGAIVTLSEDDRWVLEHLVMGEAGNQGFEGAALVAQCIRDTMVYGGIQTVEEVRVNKKYSGTLSLEPNDNVLRAVQYVFDQGGIVVKHRLKYFYAPRYCSGDWHETQQFVIEHGGHRFFDTWK